MIVNLATQGFDFSIVLSDDSQYGVEEEPGNWTGLIGMLQREVRLQNSFRIVAQM